MKNKKYILIIIALILAGYRGLRCYFPSGLPINAYIAYAMFSKNGEPLYSPDRRIKINVIFNDGGAMHSGNYFTWLVVDRAFLGKVIVSHGYSESEVFKANKVSVDWINDKKFKITYVDGDKVLENIVDIRPFL